MPLYDFHPVVARWFSDASASRPPRSARLGRHPAGRDTLIAAPTGSGKTLAAFLIAIDQLLRESLSGTLPEETRVVYVSPLKALSADIHRNLAEPRREIRRLAEEMGLGTPRITAAVRSGDTPAAERAAMLKTPPHILVTTPESLYLLLTARAEPGDAPHRPHGDRGRDPRGARVAARRAPGAEPGAAGARGPAAGAADRPVGDDGADRGGGGLAGRQRRRRDAARARSSTRATAARSTWRSSCPARRSRRSCRARSGTRSTTGWPS